MSKVDYAQLKNSLDHYEIDFQEQCVYLNPPAGSLDLSASKGSLTQSSERARKLVTTLLGREGVQALHENVQAQASTEKRKAFIDALEHLSRQAHKNSDPNKAISLEKLLGGKYKTLFLEAMEEENNSENFRNAVFLKSTKIYEGPEWKEKVVLWLGGPSASGKSYGANAAIKKISETLPHHETRVQALSAVPFHGNVVVSIDGGIEREVSQMKQLALQFALNQGYKGIKDLHPESASDKVKQAMGMQAKIKSYINKATLASNHKLNLVIPNTFTSDNATGKTAKKFKKYTALQYKQVFSEVLAEQDTVVRQGESRAWAKPKNSGPVMKINNRNIGCESKKYNPSSYLKGQAATAVAKEIYTKTCPDNIYLEIHNDNIYVKRTADGLNLVLAHQDDTETDLIRITRRALEHWQAHVLNNQDLQTLEHFLATWQTLSHLSAAKLNYRAGLKNKQIDFGSLLSNLAPVSPPLSAPVSVVQAGHANPSQPGANKFMKFAASPLTAKEQKAAMPPQTAHRAEAPPLPSALPLEFQAPTHTKPPASPLGHSALVTHTSKNSLLPFASFKEKIKKVMPTDVKIDFSSSEDTHQAIIRDPYDQIKLSVVQDINSTTIQSAHNEPSNEDIKLMLQAMIELTGQNAFTVRNIDPQSKTAMRVRDLATQMKLTLHWPDDKDFKEKKSSEH